MCRLMRSGFSIAELCRKRSTDSAQYRGQSMAEDSPYMKKVENVQLLLHLEDELRWRDTYGIVSSE